MARGSKTVPSFMLIGKVITPAEKIRLGSERRSSPPASVKRSTTFENQSCSESRDITHFRRKFSLRILAARLGWRCRKRWDQAWSGSPLGKTVSRPLACRMCWTMSSMSSLRRANPSTSQIVSHSVKRLNSLDGYKE
ncbi:hypothetical protein E2C01_017783 [Portunus trituberculatus]|uniref:Uncharacterized protein n=1 Tax=Portunus trituberculatus TaxID=210409 RepID=A0A5B7DUR8_PORTR|nr:hypothetical protein [Portunus trituberculatus]